MLIYSIDQNELPADCLVADRERQGILSDRYQVCARSRSGNSMTITTLLGFIYDTVRGFAVMHVTVSERAAGSWPLAPGRYLPRHSANRDAAKSSPHVIAAGRHTAKPRQAARLKNLEISAHFPSFCLGVWDGRGSDGCPAYAASSLGMRIRL
jgi:hypothetical protein